MKASLLPLFSLALVISSCVSPQASNDTNIVGTWRWLSVDGNRVPEPFYMRFYPNGKSVSWPAPESWSDSKGISKGGYSIANGYLIFETGRGTDNPKSGIRINNDQMTLTTNEGHRLIYNRIATPIEPGKLEDGSPAGFSKHPM